MLLSINSDKKMTITKTSFQLIVLRLRENLSEKHAILPNHERCSLWKQTPWVCILVLPVTSCATLDESLHLSVLWNLCLCRFNVRVLTAENSSED